MKEYNIESFIHVLASSNLETLRKLVYDISTRTASIEVWEDLDSIYMSFYGSTYRITFGTKFLSKLLSSKTFRSSELEETTEQVWKLIVAAIAHEAGHIAFSPGESFFSKLSTFKSDSYRQFLRDGFNIIDDTVVEDKVAFKLTFLEALFLLLRSLIFDKEENLSNIEEAVKSSPDSPATFLNYLLLATRSTMTLPAYPIWDDHKVFIDNSLHLIKTSLGKEQRGNRVIAFLSEILKMLKGEEPNEDNVKDGKSSFDESGMPDYNSNDLNVDKTIRESWRTTNNFLQRGGSDEVDESSVLVCAEEHPEDKEPSIKDDTPIKDFLRYPSKKYHPHKWTPSSVVLAGVPNKGETKLKYDKFVSLDSTKQLIHKTLNSVRKLHNHCLANRRHFRTSGKLDMQTIYKKGNYRIFYDEKNPSVKVNIVVAEVLDYSGSINRTKSSAIGQSSIIFSEVLDKLHIPFSIQMFTEQSGVCYTHRIKEFKDSYTNIKHVLMSYTSQDYIKGIVNWYGNIDEINVSAICEELLKRPEEAKILIVLSDGNTCGAEEELARVVKYYEKQGIQTLGIGVQDDTVSKIYENFVILKSSEDLNTIPQVLDKFLQSKVVRKGGK
jgi:hypothetical protein